MKKVIKWIMPLCMLAGLCSCEDKYVPDNSFYDGYTDSWDDSKFEDEESYDYKSEMQSAVNNALTIDAFYKNFCWYLDLDTELETLYPDKRFRYGVEMGYNEYRWYVYMSGYADSYSVELPVFVNGEGSPYLDLIFYWNTYKELLKKLQDEGELYSEGERSLYNNIVKMFRERESVAKSTFKYRVFVDVGDQRYYYGY
jgi:hypothetical protein